MTLDNPVNGSSPAIRTDYTGHKAKGKTCPLQKGQAFCKLLEEMLFIGVVSPVFRSPVCLWVLL